MVTRPDIYYIPIKGDPLILWWQSSLLLFCVIRIKSTAFFIFWCASISCFQAVGNSVILFQIFILYSLFSLYSLYIFYDFSGHKPDLEGKIQICFRYGFSRPVPVYKHWDCKSARPDPHVSTQKASLTKPELSIYWESRFFQTCHLSKTHGGQV